VGTWVTRSLKPSATLTATSRTIARIAGPSAIAIAATESLNMHIFAAQTAPVVYLNGALLFVGGLAIVQSHNRWRWGWPLLATLTGWGIMAVGLIRMSAPAAAQAREGPITTAIFVALLGLGGLLSYFGYRPIGGRA
jgi:hypothetical protein